MEWLRIERPHALPTSPRTVHQADSAQHVQVFGDRLARQTGTATEPHDRRRPFGRETIHQPQSHLVAKRREDPRRLAQTCRQVNRLTAAG